MTIKLKHQAALARCSLSSAHRFLVELLADGLKLLRLVLHFLALLVIVYGQLLQSLEHLLHLVLGGLVLSLQAVQLGLEVLVVTARGGEKLQREKVSLCLLLTNTTEHNCFRFRFNTSGLTKS